LLVGAHGAILAVANFAPEVCQEIFKTVKKEAEEEEKVMSSSGSSNKVIRLNKLAGQGLGQGARTYQERLLNLTEQIVTNYGIGGIKYAMSCVGYSGGYVRSPLIMPDEQGQQTIRRGLKTSGLFESLSVE
jgi:dihydrodipicolinate synthase/N-acetylneuraminate lyase